MLIWHAIWDQRGFLQLWGQDPTISETALCGIELLRDDLSRFDLEADDAQEVQILLPRKNDATDDGTKGSEAKRSSLALLPEQPFLDQLFSFTSDGKLHNLYLETTRVPALIFEPVSALSFLSSLPEESGSGVRFGPGLQYWVEATKFLLELLAHGRMLPGIQRESERFAARWQPMFITRESDEKFVALSEGMPIAAVSSPHNRTLNHFDNFALLRSFLVTGTDALIRSFLRRTPLYPDIDSIREDRNIPPRQYVAAQTLGALTSEIAEIEGPIGEVIRLEGRMTQWAAPLFGKRKDVGFRIVLRLEEPKTFTPEPIWNLKFLLHPEGEPNHRVPFEQVWQDDLATFQHLNVDRDEIEHTMLRELARAAALFPPLMESLKTFAPTQQDLSTSDAYSLLRNQGPLLREAGINLTVPDWWDESTTRLGLRLELDGNGESRLPRLGLNSLLDFSWKLSVGEHDLTDEQYQTLVEATDPLIYLDGRWVELPHQRFLRTQRFLREQQSRGQMRLRDLLKIALGMAHDEELLPVVGYRATGWIEQLLSASANGIVEVEQPEEFKGALRRYQQEGLSWFAFLNDIGVGGCLADDMGLGKTIQLLALLLHERKQAEEENRADEIHPTLLVVPMSILGNWLAEAIKFTPTLRTSVHHGSQRLSGEDFLKMSRESDLVITTYSIAHRDEGLLSQVRWGRIALDEAQNIKNLNTKQTKAIRRIAIRQLDFSPEGAHRVALTGTPLENHLEELWSIFDFLNPGYLGDLAEFRRRFSIPIERYRSTEAAQTLSALVRPFLLRRLKSDPNVIDDLPDKIEIDEHITLLPEQAALYKKVLDEMLPQLDAASGIHRKGLVLTTITRLKQICNHPSLYLKERYDSASLARSGKVRRLEELLETILAENDKVLIFSQFAQMGELLKPHLEERFRQEVLFLHGALPRAAREKLVERFQQPDGPKIFVLSLKAGGFGLNLTEANQVIHFDQWWNPAVQDQATDRAYRIGQKRSVQVRRFICRGTLEERIAQILSGKRDLAAQIVGSTKNIFTELSTDELRQLLSLDALNATIDTEELNEDDI